VRAALSTRGGGGGAACGTSLLSSAVAAGVLPPFFGALFSPAAAGLAPPGHSFRRLSFSRSFPSSVVGWLDVTRRAGAWVVVCPPRLVSTRRGRYRLWLACNRPDTPYLLTATRAVRPCAYRSACCLQSVTSSGGSFSVRGSKPLHSWTASTLRRTPGLSGLGRRRFFRPALHLDPIGRM